MTVCLSVWDRTWQVDPAGRGPAIGYYVVQLVGVLNNCHSLRADMESLPVATACKQACMVAILARYVSYLWKVNPVLLPARSPSNTVSNTRNVCSPDSRVWSFFAETLLAARARPRYRPLVFKEARRVCTQCANDILRVNPIPVSSCRTTTLSMVHVGLVSTTGSKELLFHTLGTTQHVAHRFITVFLEKRFLLLFVFVVSPSDPSSTAVYAYVAYSSSRDRSRG